MWLDACRGGEAECKWKMQARAVYKGKVEVRRRRSPLQGSGKDDIINKIIK